MKTSKRLLSLLLAVVMALTACSAGFVAFAQEINPKDNAPFNAKNASKEGSVSALTELVNDFLPDILGLIGEETLTNAGISIDAVKNASFDDASIKSDRFYELINEISPMLYAAIPNIGGSSTAPTMEAILEKEGIKADAVTPVYVFPILYKYLEDKNATVDFWTLYATCLDNANENGNEFQKLCYQYLNGDGGLREMLTFAKANFGTYAGTFVPTMNKDFVSFEKLLGITFDTINSPEEIDKKIADYNAANPNDKIDAKAYDGTSIYQSIYKYLEYFVKLTGCDVEINTLQTALYWHLNLTNGAAAPANNKKSVLLAGIYNNLANIGGADFKSLGTADGKLEFATWYDDMKSIKGNESKTKAQLAEAYLALFDKEANLQVDKDSAYYAAIDAGVKATYGVELVAFNNMNNIYSGMARPAQAYSFQTKLTAYVYDGSKYPLNQEKYMIEMVNDKINGIVNMLKDLNGAVSGLMGTSLPIDLNSALENILNKLTRAEGPNKEKLSTDYLVNLLEDVYIRLAKDPVSTIANLAPLLAVVFDEVLIPLLFNSDENALGEIGTAGETQFSLQFIYTLLFGDGTNEGLIKPDEATQETLDSIGIHSLKFDLNKIVPDVLNYINNTAGYKFTYYDKLMTTDGTRKVPNFFNIEMIDKAIADYCYNYAFVDMVGDSIEDKGLVAIIADVAKQLIPTLIKTVDSYLNGNKDLGIAAHKDDATIGWSVLGGYAEPAGQGLNNLSVSIPTLLDIFGKITLKDLGIESDWTYANRISYTTKTIDVKVGTDNDSNPIYESRTYTVVRNETIEQLKSFMFDKEQDASNVTGWIVEFVVSDMLNAVIDLANEIFTTNNEITSRIPIISSLVAGVSGGFTDLSMFTDIFNGFFGLTRDSEYSFTFAERSIPCSTDSTTYNGLSEESAYFLIANIGNIVRLIINIVNAPSEPTPEEIAEMLAPYSDAAAATPRAANKISIKYPDFAKYLTKENINAANELIDTVDDLISTLLENTYIDGFKADELDGILSSVVTFVSNLLGTEATDDLLHLVQQYINVINAENEPEDGKVNVKKVFSEKNLSTLVTETYALIEEVINSLVAIPGDDYGVIANAVKGIVSPGAVVAHSNNLNEDLTSFFSWVEIRDSKYAKDLGFKFDAGDKNAFYANLYDSLGAVASVVGALLCTNNAQGENLYNDVLVPILNQINAKCGVFLLPNAANGKEVLVGITESLGGLVNAMLKAPATTLLNVLSGLMGALSDDVINPAATALLNTVLGEINGLIGNNSVLSFISPELKNYVMGLLETLSPGIGGTLNTILGFDLTAFFEPGTENAFVMFINTLLVLLPGMLGVDIPLNPLPEEFDLVDLNKSTPAEFLLKLYAIIVETVLDDSTLQLILGESYADVKNILDMMGEFDAATVLGLIRGLLAFTTSPTETYWSFDNYVAKANTSFKYPSGITSSDANKAVDSLDDLVANVFPLLQQFGVLQQGSLTELLNGLAFTNANVTALAKALYGALDGALGETLKSVDLDITSPSALALFLSDGDTYSRTYNDAANALLKAKSWDDVKTLNWGFKDGSFKAGQGFINALTAVLRPIQPVLAVLLGEASIDFTEILKEIAAVEIDMPDDGSGISVSLSNGVLTVKMLIELDGTEGANENVITIDLLNILNSIDKIAIYGANGYESAIIPLLEAFMCDGVKTFDEYVADYNADPDNILLDILNPILGFVNKLAAAPVDTLTAVLPNVAYFIDNNGIAQVLDNLLAPVTKTLLPELKKSGLDIDKIIAGLLGSDLGSYLTGLLGIKANLKLDLGNLSECNIQDILIPALNSLLPSLGVNIKLPEFKWSTIASHGVQKTVASAARNTDGEFKTIRIVSRQGETLVAVLRYVEALLVQNASALEGILAPILGDDATIKNIVKAVFNNIKVAGKDDIVKAVFYLLKQEGQNKFFDYSGFQFKEYDFEYPTTLDMDFLNVLAPMIDGILNGVLDQFMPGGLNGLLTDNLYTDSIITSLVTGIYGAVEGVAIDANTNLAQLLAMTGIDFTTSNVAALLTNKDYGQSYDAAAKLIAQAGSWKNVNADKLVWGVKDRDTFLHALTAALRPVFGVVDVLLNNGSLGLFDLVYVPGTDGYTSTIVPLMEAFGLYNIKTQYQYREDISKEYDAILLDIMNPLFDKVEDILNAPIQTLADMLPNLALFFANDGLLQLIDNLLVPITALLDALKPIVNVNALLPVLGLDVNALLGGIGIKDVKFDIYDLKATLEPVIGSANILGVVNGLLGSLGVNIELMPIDWYQLASHGTVVTNEPSQAATYGSRIYVVSNRNEVLVAVLRYLINTLKYKDNLDAIQDLIGGLLGDADPTVSDVVGQVLGMLNGETDDVLSQLCDLLQTFA